MHRDCCDRLGADDPLRLVVDSLYAPPRCAVCTDLVADGKDGFSAGFLTSRTVAPAFRFNFCNVHDACFSDWDARGELLTALRETVDSPTWLGPELRLENGAPRWHFRRRRGWVIPA